MKNGFAIGLLAVSVLIASFAGAQTPSPTAAPALANPKAWWLPSYAAEYACRLDFVAAQANAVIAVSANASASLSPLAASLNNDKGRLSSLSTGDAKTFEEYVRDTANPDIKAAIRAISNSRRPLSADQKAAVKAGIAAADASRESCATAALKGHAGDKVAVWNSNLASFQKTVDSYAKMGIGTGVMAGLAGDGTGKILLPLQAAVAAAANSTQVRTALRTYCLYDGCGAGGAANLHLSANFEIARLNAVLAWVSPNATRYNVSTARAQEAISAAASTMASVGQSDFARGQGRQVWSEIAKAQREVRNVRLGLQRAVQRERMRSGQQAARQKRQEAAESKRAKARGRAAGTAIVPANAGASATAWTSASASTSSTSATAGAAIGATASPAPGTSASATAAPGASASASAPAAAGVSPSATASASAGASATPSPSPA